MDITTGIVTISKGIHVADFCRNNQTNVSYIISNLIFIVEQDCIPVGCIPPAC